MIRRIISFVNRVVDFFIMRKIDERFKVLSNGIAYTNIKNIYMLREADFIPSNLVDFTPSNSKIPLEEIKNKKLIVSLTTHSSRIYELHLCLESLRAQTLRPSKVRLYITEGEYHYIPAIVRKFTPWLEIIETKNIGSYKKFIPALANAKNDELIISLDDDFIFTPLLVESLFTEYCIYPNCLNVVEFGIAGIDEKGENVKGSYGKFVYPGGGFGVLWDSNIFNPSTTPKLFLEEVFIKYAYNHDDLWIAIAALIYNIDFHKIEQINGSDCVVILTMQNIGISASKDSKYHISAETRQKMDNILIEYFNLQERVASIAKSNNFNITPPPPAKLFTRKKRKFWL